MSAPGSHYVGLFQTFFSCDFIVLFQFAKIYSAQVSLLLTLHTLSLSSFSEEGQWPALCKCKVATLHDHLCRELSRRCNIIVR